MARKIDFQLGFTVDKAQLTELQQVLKQIQKDAESATGTGSIATQLSKASVEAEKLERILNQSWNGKLNQLDVSKFTKLSLVFGKWNWKLYPSKLFRTLTKNGKIDKRTLLEKPHEED